MFLKRVKVEKELLLDGNEYTRHRLNLSFVKVGMLPKSENSVNPILPVSHMLQQEGMSNGMQACHFHERMSHVASTGDSVAFWGQNGKLSQLMGSAC